MFVCVFVCTSVYPHMSWETCDTCEVQRTLSFNHVYPRDLRLGHKYIKF